MRDRTLVDVPQSIGPVVFGTLGVGWVMVRCPHEYDDLMRRAGLWSRGHGSGWWSGDGSSRCSASWNAASIPCSGPSAFTWNSYRRP